MSPLPWTQRTDRASPRLPAGGAGLRRRPEVAIALENFWFGAFGERPQTGAMGVVVSLIVIALGAILTFAVTGGDDSGVDLDVVGIILMIVGLIGFLLSLMYWSSWGGPGFMRRRTYVEGDPAYPAYGRRTRVVEEEDAPPGPPPP